MTTKTITITQSAYLALAGHKKGGESFSELIKRSFSQKGDVWRFAGAWKHLEEKAIEDVKKDIERMTSQPTKQLLKKLRARP